jgi:hypothetical protein
LTVVRRGFAAAAVLFLCGDLWPFVPRANNPARNCPV